MTAVFTWGKHVVGATFLIKRGERAVRGVTRAHIARYDERGKIVGSMCYRSGFDVSSNVPWGLPICKNCLRRWDGGAL